jgi:hypothetical protein
MSGLRLNLGCGANLKDGYINVDKFGEPDVRHDLEVFPWPWPDDSVVEILLIHVLEHLGQDPNVFLGIMKELYRVCQDGATVGIVVPDPRHENFLSDPTHVRPITPKMLTLFSQQRNRDWIARGCSNSPLALFHGIDFELTDSRFKPSDFWTRNPPDPLADFSTFMQEASLHNNMIEEIHMTLRAIKPAGRECGL